jgi:hypothetical protein
LSARESVPLNRLDDLCSITSGDRTLLKVDVQGYEKQVLDGATTVLGKALAVQIELSTVALYEGQASARQLMEYFFAQGFDIWSLEPVLRQPETLRLLQLDCIFVRARH